MAALFELEPRISEEDVAGEFNVVDDAVVVELVPAVETVFELTADVAPTDGANPIVVWIFAVPKSKILSLSLQQS